MSGIFGNGCRALLAATALVAFSTASFAGEFVETQAPAPGWEREWPATDFSRSTVPFGEILSGGPPKDGIPAVDEPEFGPVADETRLEPAEPVVSLELDGAARAYPLRYLIWHEIVNDVVAGVPVAVTYCPLCNSALVFESRVDGTDLTFGVSGKLRHSDLIMYDRQSESWWQQFLGAGIVGVHAGTQLTAIPVLLESWESFRSGYPEGEVMQQPNFPRPYGHNPYRGYDTSPFPFLYRGNLDMLPDNVAPLSRVVRVGERAWPLARLREEGEILEAGLRLNWREGQASALDTSEISKGRDVGNVTVQDADNGDLIVHEVIFAFVFQAFVPEGVWMQGG